MLSLGWSLSSSAMSKRADFFLRAENGSKVDSDLEWQKLRSFGLKKSGGRVKSSDPFPLGFILDSPASQTSQASIYFLALERSPNFLASRRPLEDNFSMDLGGGVGGGQGRNGFRMIQVHCHALLFLLLEIKNNNSNYQLYLRSSGIIPKVGDLCLRAVPAGQRQFCPKCQGIKAP